MKQKAWVIAMAAIALLATGCKDKKTSENNIIVVKTMGVGMASTAFDQTYSGTIEETSGTSLSFATPGTIKSLTVKEGQFVSARQVIGVVDASTTANTLAMSKATTAQARAQLKQAEDAYERMKMLHDNGSLPEMKWVEVKTKVAQAREMLASAEASEKIARKGVADTRLTAPFAGYIADKTADVGENVAPGQPVAKLVKIDRVKVKISVPEDEIARMKVGQEVRFSVASLGGASFMARVAEKSVSADPISRSYTVYATVDNPGHRLLPGMVCDVSTALAATSGQAITLPANIIQIDIDNRPFVWAVEGGKAKRVYVALGENVGENVVIESGIAQGTKVIVSGQQKVSNGMAVAIE